MIYYDKAIKSGRLESIILGISSAFDLFPRWQQVLPDRPIYQDPAMIRRTFKLIGRA